MNNNSYYQADTFRVTFAANALPAETDANWLSDQKEAFVEIFAGFPADPQNFSETDLDSLIYGQVDDVEYDPVATTVTLTGRDMTAAFIDTKTSVQYQNLTSSQIATKLAEAHGLTASGPATKTPAGTFYAYDHVSMTDERSEWDLLTYLAENEGFLCYIRGTTLHFEPRPTEQGDPYVIRWAVDENGLPSANVQDLNLSRSMTVAKGVTVVARSYNTKQKQGFTAYYPSKGKTTQPGQASPSSNRQVYTIRRGGLTQEAVTQLAQKTHREITQHEMKLWARLPADNILTQTAMVRLEGTGTKFDQDYYVDSITRSMSVDHGYSMTVSAKNHNPESVPAL
ncbi:phage late control D family protein [Cupriavidus necator]|uniref:phage late control D family protein n=1 Tax=Cupriavidus necator TaxID=106590 RepID=UPI003F7359D6